MLHQMEKKYNWKSFFVQNVTESVKLNVDFKCFKNQPINLFFLKITLTFLNMYMTDSFETNSFS